ncbi:hypothetical protein GAGA_0905 [Paraglaciecola agarilytica NO2]|uniref:Uncharacterized protein n=1 Tax=Paraglaciecola agarilytica NO2 TaxID=1125747 RepID=A0ABQ0I373_9ALTE|nr:hypothetical protein GAGA_0905 [Paraglaciecola agarilytica NO2]
MVEQCCDNALVLNTIGYIQQMAIYNRLNIKYLKTTCPVGVGPTVNLVILGMIKAI